MIVISENGGKIMKMVEDFDKYAKEELHLVNPFHAWLRSSLSTIRTTKTDGPICIDLEKSREIDRATKADREEWIRLRDRYVAERILRELGYEVLVTTHYAEYMPDAIPCEGATGQCSLFCPKYFECGL